MIGKKAGFVRSSTGPTNFDALIRALSSSRKAVFGQAEAELRRLLRRLRRKYESIVATGFFRAEAATRAEVAWQDFLANMDTLMFHPPNACIERLPGAHVGDASAS